MKEIKIKISADSDDATKEITKVQKELKKINDIDIESSFDEIYGDAKSLTQVMGGLQDRLYELAKAGKTNTKEFKVLTAETARLRKAQISVDRAVDATARTLGEKLSNGANLAASAYSILQGSMVAMNLENEEMEASLQRIVSAMAVTQGVAGFTQALQGTVIATKAAAVAQRLWNLALSANPIGLVLTGITALVGGFTLLTSWMSKNTDEAKAQAQAQKDLDDRIKLTNMAIDGQVARSDRLRIQSKEYTDQAIREAQARGVSTAEIRKMEKASMDASISKSMETIGVLANARALSLETSEVKRNRVEKLKSMIEEATIGDRFFGERIKWQKELDTLNKELEEPTAEEDTYTYQLGQQNIVLSGLLDERTKMINDHKVQIIGEDAQAQKDARPKVKGLDNSIKTEGFSDSESGDALSGMFSNITQDGLDNELEMFASHINNINDLYRSNADAKLSADAEKMESDIAIAQSLQYGFDVASGLAKEGSDLQKAMLIAKQAAAAVELGLSIKSTITAAKETAAKTTLKASEAAVDASTGAIKTAASAPFPANLPLIIGYGAAAAGIMSGVISATKKSSSTASRYGGGSGGSAPTPSVQAPSFNLVEGQNDSSSVANSIKEQGRTPLKAYVVSGDIVSEASLNRNIKGSSSI